MDSAFNTDMDTAAQWPVTVDIAVRVDYPNGPPEHNRLRLDGLSAASAVRVSRSRPGANPQEPELVRWTDLPGETLFMRCLNVLAVNLFGSVEMPPRIVGTPLWSALTLDMTLAADDPQALHLEVGGAAAGHAHLRWRLRRDKPLQTSLVVLDNLDADPLRAVLRLGMSHPQLLPKRHPYTAATAATATGRRRGRRPPAAAAGAPPAEAATQPAGQAISSGGD